MRCAAGDDSASASSPTVAVLGGSGFVGRRVCEALVGAGATVVSVSKSGTAPEECAGESWASAVTWKQTDLVAASADDIAAAIAGADAVVSCVGVIGKAVQARARLESTRFQFFIVKRITVLST